MFSGLKIKYILLSSVLFKKYQPPQKLKTNKTQKLKSETEVLSSIHLNSCLFSLKPSPPPIKKRAKKHPEVVTVKIQDWHL